MPPRNNRNKDRLSELPDHILAQILSNLPTIDSVRTCILSKRWVRLWTHITTLDFDSCVYDDRLNGNEQDYIDIYWFENFVSMVLHRLATPSIESFEFLNEDGVIHESAFRTWGRVLAKKRVKNLIIYYLNTHNDFEIIRPIFFIRHILTSHSLVHLSLFIDCIIKVPNFVHLPYLQTLELCHNLFTSDNDSGNSEENIVLSFPVLKKLKSNQNFWWNVKSVSFEVPFLEMVEIIETKYSFDTCLVNYNIISKPSPYVNSSVSIIYLGVCESEEERKRWGLRACILFKQLNINQVKHLEISSTKVLSFAKESFADLPTFNMLHHLKLDRVSGRMLIELLLKSPYLTSLTIKMEELESSYWLESDVEVSKPDHAEKLLEYGIVPDCISNTLKVLKVENFGGHEDEFSLVKYMMDNAEHLELLSISPSSVLECQSKKEEMEKVLEKLFSMKRDLNLTTMDLSHFERCSNKWKMQENQRLLL